MTKDTNIQEAAATWFAMQRRGPMSLDERDQFDLWRADPRHQAALNHMHELWGETAALKSAGIKVPKPYLRRVLPVAIAACLVLGITAGLYWTSNLNSFPITTGIGEQRSQTLSDGSILAMNVVSRARYDDSPTIRRIHLDEGEATFIVKKEEGRPFTVVAGDYEVRAIGTAFNVLNRNGSVHVAVKEGIVEVRQKDGYAKPVTLRAGQRLSFKPGDLLVDAKYDLVDSRNVDEWRQRVLSYADAPVTRVAEDLNRFFERPVTVDPVLANSRVTIRLVVDDRADTLTRLAGILNADIKTAPKHDLLSPSLQ